MSHANQFALFRTKRFWPLFAAQAIGAFNDNAFRFALSIILIYTAGNSAGLSGSLLNTISAGLNRCGSINVSIRSLEPRRWQQTLWCKNMDDTLA